MNINEKYENQAYSKIKFISNTRVQEMNKSYLQKIMYNIYMKDKSMA